MSPANQYKKLENRAVNTLVRIFRIFFSDIKNSFRKAISFGKQKFTIMFIPHSEKKIVNFKISVFFLVFIGFLSTGILVTFFVLSSQYGGVTRLLSLNKENLENTNASLEIVRDEIFELRRVSKMFEKTVSNTLETLGIESSSEISTASAGGDLASFFGVEEEKDSIIKELSELRRISSFMNDSVASIDKLKNLLMSHGELLRELPTYWPVKGSVGRITTYFGPTDHPFTKKYYLHKGVDIAYRSGVPIIATAQGKVVDAKYDKMFGYYVVIRHKYGFYTKYAHMGINRVREGDFVRQGQVIGIMGNTGLSTGPHLHYEVRIGSQVVDPLRYLDIKTGLKGKGI